MILRNFGAEWAKKRISEENLKTNCEVNNGPLFALKVSKEAH